ncbi:MAG: helix-turn-helix domain-containing protein [Bacteroidales bacterium]|nr:helix-turn-helix domain-containing protein [Bacteroidales bacterium]
MRGHHPPLRQERGLDADHNTHRMMRQDRPITHPKRRYTQKDGAALIGVHPSTLRKWELRGLVTSNVTRYGVKYYTGAQLTALWETHW